MINKFFIEGQCIEGKNNAIYDKEKNIFVGTFNHNLRYTRTCHHYRLITITLYFFGNLAEWMATNYIPPKFYIFETSLNLFNRIRKYRPIIIDDETHVKADLYGRCFVVNKIFRSNRKYIGEQSKQEKELKLNNSNSGIDVDTWEKLAQRITPIRTVINNDIKVKLAELGIEEVEND